MTSSKQIAESSSSMNSKIIIFLFNYRTLFGYIMTMTYICMHYYMSSNQQLILMQTNDLTTISTINSNHHENILNNNNNNNNNLNIVKKPRRLLLQNYDYFLVSKSKRNIHMNIYSTSDKSIILNTLKRNQRLIVDKSLNGKRKLIIENENDDLKFDYNHHNKINYNLKNKTIQFSSQILQDQILLRLLNTSYLNNLNASYNGVFVEAGAYDGETWSNTLYLERFKNWTGLLIEPSSENYMKLKNKNRNAYSINNCLSKSSARTDFIEAGPFGITTNVTAAALSSNNDVHTVTCHPLEKILNTFFNKFSQFKYKKSNIYANSKPTIDYMSLDIEGNEKTIVETFPWNNFQINFLNIEYNQNKEIYEWLKSYLRRFGYLETLVDDVWYQDVYLAHESVYSQLNMKTKYVSQF